MHRASQAIVIAGLCFFCLASSRGDTFIVTNSDSLGAGSLAEAIDQANAHPGADTIVFNIPGDGVHGISVGDHGLPEITDPVTIDGYTQPGAKANSLAVGNDAIILIWIDGDVTYAIDGLLISAGDSVVRGLRITSFPSGITLRGGGGNFIEGNAIGFSDVLYLGYNLTGLNVSSSDNTIGGVLPGQRNVISNNHDAGVSIDSEASGNIILGNYIGTDATGMVALGNGYGLMISGTATQVGGPTSEATNVISGNGLAGIYIAYPASENVVEGNLIGTDATGAGNVANLQVGVSITGSNNLIGGLAAGATNRIFFNFCAVQVTEGIDSGHRAVGNSILSNSIYAPGIPIIGRPGDPIDLDLYGNFEGPSRNDLGDGDTGPNNLQNFPIITSTSFLPDRTTVRGGLNSTPSETFILQLYARDLTEGTADFLVNALDTETITTNEAGQAYFTFDLPPLPLDIAILATVTDSEGNTSELSNQDSVQVANISTRGQVGIGDDILISGFVVHRAPGGPADYTKKVLLRALGPSLEVDGVPLAGRLENPTLELHDASGAVLATNDDWRSDQEAEIIAAGVAPSSDAEAVLIADLPDGSYTVQVRGVGSSVGLGLTEVYDLEPLDPDLMPASGRLVNISTRGLVGTGDNPLIAGLIVNGDDAEDRDHPCDRSGLGRIDSQRLAQSDPGVT